MGRATGAPVRGAPAVCRDAWPPLALGRVAVIATVTVNGLPVTALRGSPFRTEITSYLKPGANQLEIKVITSWFNRLVYDDSFPSEKQKTWTIHSPAKTAPFELAGLISPVRLHLGTVHETPP